MNNYEQFLQSKSSISAPSGIEISDIHPKLFPFQRDITKWALRIGKACIFADCGLGKSFMQLEWARHIGGDVLILAPLAVSSMLIKEGEKIDIRANLCRKQVDVKPGINITNYEMLHAFDPSAFKGIVLDESSILKSFDGKTRTEIITAFGRTPYRLACTATPAPNDYMELGNHSEFLGIMGRSQMLSMFFVHDGKTTQNWRLKGHAENKFWEWVASWACILRKPSDLGYEDDGFILPRLNIHEEIIDIDKCQEGYLFPVEAQSLNERRAARKSSMSKRVELASGYANESKKPFLLWCDLNAESEALHAAIPDSTEVRGSDSADKKTESLLAFSSGDIRVLITKPSIAGHGMNWQHCADMAFVGLSDSYEQFYQATRRCWRFGQKNEVNVHIIIGSQERNVLSNIKRKQAQLEKLQEGMVQYTKNIVTEHLHKTERRVVEYRADHSRGNGWQMYLGDCIDILPKIESDTIHYSIFSPPFSSLYTYSDSERDLGNSKNDNEFFAHLSFLIKELYRVTIPGRLLSFHCMNLPTSKQCHGHIGLRDFRGNLIRAFEGAGWIYHSEVVIWKDPVTAMQRTKALGLLWKQIKKDSSMCRQGVPDYLVTMRKPGENKERVIHTAEGFPVERWQRYASPVWMDINQSNTLQRTSAREHKDERHICPLQLEVIQRALELWTNPGDTVLSPFAGIGSEGYQSILAGRRFIGVELKQSYYNQAMRNLARAETSIPYPLFEEENESVSGEELMELDA